MVALSWSCLTDKLIGVAACFQWSLQHQSYYTLFPSLLAKQSAVLFAFPPNMSNAYVMTFHLKIIFVVFIYFYFLVFKQYPESVTHPLGPIYDLLQIPFNYKHAQNRTFKELDGFSHCQYFCISCILKLQSECQRKEKQPLHCSQKRGKKKEKIEERT